MKRYWMPILFGFVFIIYIIFFCKALSIFDNSFFEFHDVSQPARIQEFTYALTHGQIPPRIAFHFSHGLGFPVFNFYAPFSYFVTSFINILGFDVINALKISLVLSLAVSFIGTYLFLRLFFKEIASITGAFLYSTSLYIALDIFVRGNLAEVWFIGLLPFAFYGVTKNAKEANKSIFVLTTMSLWALLICHNILSLIALPILIVYLLCIGNIKRNIISVLMAISLSSFFYIPFIFENLLIFGREIATKTDYHLHFVCLNQFWNSPWGFAGSAPGCIDGMSFQLGKPQIFFSLLGSFVFLYYIITKKQKGNIIYWFFIALTTVSLFLSLNESIFIWNIFSPLMSIIQFPWRFISFSLIGMAFLGAYFVDVFNKKYQTILLVVIVIMTSWINAKYFTRPTITKMEFERTYLSSEFISSEAAYKVPEYLPKTVDYNAWLNLEHKPLEHFSSPSGTIDNETVLPFHYFPFWKIEYKGRNVIPHTFDVLGRPIIAKSMLDTVHVSFRQTFIEMIGNIASIVALGFLLLMTHETLWKKIK